MIYIMAYNRVTKEATCLEATRTRRGLGAKVDQFRARFEDFGQYGYDIKVEEGAA